MRLLKYLARAGVASRRKAEQIIRDGRVRVNGTMTTLPQADVTDADLIMVDGVKIRGEEEKFYLLLDKPDRCISSAADTHGRRTVLDLVKGVPARVYPVGRLDEDTRGVLFLTNDGELAYRLTHPRFKVEKAYRAWVRGVPTREALAKLAGGLEIEGGRTAPAKVKLVKTDGAKRAMIEIILTEGRKRQVKAMFETVGHPVINLRRTRFAFLTVQGMRSGEYRHLTSGEVRRLRRQVGL